MEKLWEISGIRYITKNPTAAQIEEAKVVEAKAFRKALDSGALLKASLTKVLMDQGLWTELDEDKLMKLRFKIGKLERQIKSKISKQEVLKIALELRKSREEFRQLISRYTGLEDKSVESKADEARLLYFASVCTYDYLTQKPAFASVDSFMEKVNEDLAQRALTEIATIVYQLDPDFSSKLPEERIFARFGEPEVVVDQELKAVIEEIAAIDVVDDDIDKIEYVDESVETDNVEKLDDKVELVN